MKSKKLTFVLVLSAYSILSGTAFATDHSQVKLYGVIDTGIYAHHSSNGSSVVEMASGITKGSRFGFEGSEELGDGYKIYFRLEQGFESDNGKAKDSDAAFYRDSYLGLSSPYGSFEFGRTGALTAGTHGGIVGGMSPFGITWKEGALSKIFAGNISARLNNMVRYESPSLNGAKFFAQYSNGIEDDEIASSQKNRFISIGATYRYKSLRLIAAFDNLFYNDSETKTEAGVAAGKGLKDQRTYNVGGSYDFGTVRLYLGYQFGKNVKTPRQGDAKGIVAAKYDSKDRKAAEGYDTNAITMGTKIKLFGGELNGTLGYAHAKRDFNDSKANVYQAMVGYKYPLSKRTYAYGAVGFIHAKSENTKNVKKTSIHSVDRVNTRSFFAGLCHEF
ncbi:porin [Parasutterella sp.]|jgi:predicted porin|uniref:porin n=1 Tax=Parasutterella sp. TaxID=2049037 RepID=UPI003522877F